jgi:hypothetical protein
VTTTSKYAQGDEAWGLCQYCGLRYLLRDLVFDGYYPNLRVCTECYNTRQPQEFLVDVTDPVALWKPSPEFGPVDPCLTAYGLIDSIVTIWTEAFPRGGSRVDSYAVYRQTQNDDGTWTVPTLLATLPVTYYADSPAVGYLIGGGGLADLVENGNPIFDNEGIESETLTFTDDDVVAGDTYQYQVIANLDSGRQAASNYADASTSDWHAIDQLTTVPNVVAGTLVSVVIFTSRPYPSLTIEQANTSGIPDSAPQYQVPAEAINMAPLVDAGTNEPLLVIYTNWPAEAIHTVPDAPSGTNEDVLIVYTNWPAEAINMAGTGPTAGTNEDLLITYLNWPPEPINTAPTVDAGTLT